MEPASKSSVPTIRDGVILVVLRFLSLLLTSALQTTLSPATMVGGAILLDPILIWQCPCSSRSLNIVPVSSRFLTAGNIPLPLLSFVVTVLFFWPKYPIEVMTVDLIWWALLFKGWKSVSDLARDILCPRDRKINQYSDVCSHWIWSLFNG